MCVRFIENEWQLRAGPSGRAVQRSPTECGVSECDLETS